MKINIISSLLFATVAVLATGCYEDKGNYTYKEIEEITIEMPRLVEAMEASEYIEFEPVITSSITGDISANNSDYKFGCKVNRQWRDELGQTHNWLDMNPEGNKAVKFFANLPAASYRMWYTVENVKTGVVYSAEGNLQVKSTTSEGWMVLSNNGADKLVTLDMLFTDAQGREMTRRNVWGDDNALPLYGAISLQMDPSLYANMERIMMTTESGSYRLNLTTLMYNSNDNIKMYDFMISTTPGEVVGYKELYWSGQYGPVSRCCVTSEGDAYGVFSNSAGAAFENLMNTDYPGNDATYKVSRFIGVSQARPGNTYVALMYDTTNKRFMGWNYNGSGNNKKLLFPLLDPENPKFSFATGMDIVDMQSTRFSNGVVYSILQDATGHRHVYGIYVTGYVSSMEQDNVWHDINSEDFDTADKYAFHSQYPFMFYAKDNKVYSYHLSLNKVLDKLQFDSSEKVTMIKFNLYANMNYNALNKWGDEDFEQKQYELIVGSTKGGADGGIVRFYKIGIDGKMTMTKEYTGLGESPVDCTYREVRK